LSYGIGNWAVACAIGAVFLLVPQWIGGLVHIRKIHKALVYQAHLREDLTKAVAQVGGPARVLRCGSVMTEGFQVPMVAWALGTPTTRVEAPPRNGGAAYPEPAEDAPNVILQTRDTRSAHLLPLLSTWPSVRYHYAGTAGPVHMFTHACGASS
jgi:hypothetical protein